MRKQLAIVILFMLAFAGAGSSALVNRSFAGSKPLSPIQREKRLGPKPTPRWYWHWQRWRITNPAQRLRPAKAPHRIPKWSWRRLHFFMLARKLAAEHKRKPPTHKTTTTTTAGSTASAAGYAGAISYTQLRPAFTPARTIGVSNASQLLAAIADLRAGDLVKATAPFTVSGETVIKNRLSSPAELDLNGVTFVYDGGANNPAVWLNNAQHLYIYGGDLSTADTGGSCLLSYGGQYVTWWGFTAHDCGGNGFSGFTVTGAAQHDDFQGEIWKVGQNLAWDPHAEKGSGLHCANLDDSGVYPFQDNRFAFYCHDIPVGAAIEYGDSNPSYPPVRNTIYLKAVNLTFTSKIQTGGNGIQFWGVDGQSADIRYLEVANAQGYSLFAGGMNSGTTLSGVTVERGTATNTNLNPRYASQNPWDTAHGVIYKAVQPAQ